MNNPQYIIVRFGCRVGFLSNFEETSLEFDDEHTARVMAQDWSAWIKSRIPKKFGKKKRKK